MSNPVLRRCCATLAGCLMLVTPALAQIPIGTAFTYQGQLTDGGNPANGAYDFQLLLYDAAVGGSQVGPIITRDDVVVSGGLFTALVDFGSAFDGNKRYLELQVRPGASTGTYTIVQPRQELSPAPNALYTSSAPWSGLIGMPPGFADGVDNDSGGDITGVIAGIGLTGGGPTGVVTLDVNYAGSGAAATASRSDHDHFGQTWTGGAGVFGLRVQNSSTTSNSAGLRGMATATFGGTIGVDGQSDSTVGTGVRGFATSTAGATNGVYGLNSSSGGTGVRGVAIATTGATQGVYGQSFSSTGTGVYGIASATAGTNYGVYGRSDSSDGYAGFFLGRLGVNGDIQVPLVTSRVGPLETLDLSAGGDVRTILDNNSGGLGDAQWFHGAAGVNANQLAELRSNAGFVGNFLVRGTVTTGVTTFDLAERFRKVGEVEAGDVVRVDPSRPDAVARTTDEGDAAVLGVVSTAPAILLGGTTFDSSALRAFGDDLEEAFLAEKATLEAEVLNERPQLQAALQRLDSEVASPELQRTRNKIEQGAIERFAEDRLAPVALAGRVPVKVDASYGVVAVGDLLGPSPIPGVAMKARGGPVIGTALEGLSSGRGKILTFVHRGQSTAIIAKDERIAALEARVAALENALQKLANH